MTILHIAHISNNMCSGVNAVVPQHILAQQEYATVGFVNTADVKINNIANQFDYSPKFSLSKLPKPFSLPDLVVFHEVYYLEYIKIAKGLRRINVPYIIIPHCALSKLAQRKKRLKKTIANLLLFNHFIRNALAIQCLSSSEAESTKFGNTKIIATNGIIIPLNPKRSFSANDIKLLYIGRLDVYHKGIDLLLMAVDKVKEYLKEHNGKLFIYGPDYKGNFDRIKKEIFKKRIDDIVILNHQIVGEAKTQELLSADYFIQTSRFEGMPMGILEAMSYGIPCIITRGTGLADLFEKYNAGWVCEMTVNSIAEQIEKAIEEKSLLNTKSENSILCAKEIFDWNIIGKNTVATYKKLALRGCDVCE